MINVFFLPPILINMHLCIVQWTYRTPLATGPQLRKLLFSSFTKIHVSTQQLASLESLFWRYLTCLLPLIWWTT